MVAATRVVEEWLESKGVVVEDFENGDVDALEGEEPDDASDLEED